MSCIKIAGNGAKKNVPWGCHGMRQIPGGVGIFYGPGHTKYRDYQGILSISTHPFSSARPNFRLFCKKNHKNNRELIFIEQGFHLTISGNKFTTFIPLYVRNDNN